MEYQSFSIRALIDDVIKGAIRIPAFQRGFVWNYDSVAYLMDSIYKNYPFGSLLFWRTKNSLASERRLGLFELPSAPKEYPINYVLDGQQRLTSIFSVFQTELKPVEGGWPEIYFNLVADDDYQESRFSPMLEDEIDPAKHFPLSCLFDPVAYRRATDPFADDAEKLRMLDDLQARFKEVSIPVQILTTEERSSVAIVFERINRLGMELDTLQLLSAWTWNEDFDLLQEFDDLKEDLEEFGFSDVGEDTNLVLRCASAILTGDSTPDRLIEMNGSDVRANFPKVTNGIKGAIDFLRKQMHVVNLKSLPYNALLVPLSVFFAEPDGRDVTYSDETLDVIKRWFWRSCFDRRYSSQTKRTSQRDIQEIVKLKNGYESRLDDIDVGLSEEFFSSVFKISSANTKTFILMLINNKPKTFLSGGAVDLDKVLQKYNRAEFHHLYPKAQLKKKDVGEEEINALYNFAIINGADNRRISNKKPSAYKAMVGSSEKSRNQITGSALCPSSLFEDDYEKFRVERVAILMAKAGELIGD